MLHLISMYITQAAVLYSSHQPSILHNVFEDSAFLIVGWNL